MSGGHYPVFYYGRKSGAMKTKHLLFKGLFLGALAGCFVLPAQADYHYSYGNSKVTRQNQTGLHYADATYIGAGTLSQSAQGKRAGVGGDLPAVNMGSHVRQPGDCLYDGTQTLRDFNGSLIYKDQFSDREGARYSRARAQQQAMMRRQRYRERHERQGNYYMPGSNGGAATYGSAPEANVIYKPGGVASYGDQGSAPSGARRF